MAKLYNFLRTDLTDINNDKIFQGPITDQRNGISCSRLTLDFDTYYNYIKYIMENRDKWTNYGYFDLGLVPLAMAPSYMHEAIKKKLLELTKNIDLPVHILPSISLLTQEHKLKTTDVWVSREDVENILGISFENTSTESIIKEIFRRNGISIN